MVSVPCHFHPCSSSSLWAVTQRSDGVCQSQPVCIYRSSFQSVTVAKPNANRRAAKGSSLGLGRKELDFQHLDWICRINLLFSTVSSLTVEVLAVGIAKSKGTNGLIRWVHGRPDHQEFSSLSGSGNPWTTDYQKLRGWSRKSISICISFSHPLSLNTHIDANRNLVQIALGCGQPGPAHCVCTSLITFEVFSWEKSWKRCKSVKEHASVASCDAFW